MTRAPSRSSDTCREAFLKTISACVTAAVLIGAPALPRIAQAGDIPTFAVEASWPKPLPNNWILGQVGGIAVDGKDHIWVIHRPRSLTDDEKGAALNPPRSKCCVPAPPVIEFDADGNLLRSWGGPGEGYEWVGSEHGIEVDEKGYVWVAGNAANDNAILKFTPRRQVRDADRQDRAEQGLATTPPSSASPPTPHRHGGQRDLCRRRLRQPPRHRVRRDDRRLQAALGRLWQAAERRQAAALRSQGAGAAEFANPVHCVKLANDGLVYVCDRINNRIQVFRKDGTFVKEFFFEKNTLGNGAIWDIAIWPDPNQTYLLSADGENNEIRVLKREDGSVVGSFGRNGRNAGQFHWVHAIAVDAKGNVYTAEVDTGKRIQKFKLTSDALR